MTTAVLSSVYSLKDVREMVNHGIFFKIPEDTVAMINQLCSQVGSAPLSSSVYSKAPRKPMGQHNTVFPSHALKQGLNAKDKLLNEIRLTLNKVTDKNYLDMVNQIIEKIELVLSLEEGSGGGAEDRLASLLIENCSTNKFYSKIFADVFATLALKYDWLKARFQLHYANLMEQYQNIRYVDSEKDYDGFCEMNKANEKRKAITTFYFNLTLNGFIPKDGMVDILKTLLTSILTMISMPDKKNEVDELTEIVAILYHPDMMEENEYYYVLEQSITNTIIGLSTKSAKDYPSLSNKAIFKYMDMV